ncbi:MAG: phosphatase PAP2 family protein [Verrucomicrobia bacterium]|nr:phosphatase PAP2 family protein [Verrucomicrobiota bacterium]
MNASAATLKNHPLTAPREWKLKILLLCHIVGAMLFASLFWPVTRSYWEMIDVAFFKLINSTLRDRPNWQIFWALANHKLADWVEDICVLCFFIAYVRMAHKSLRKRKVSELIFCVLYIGAIIYFINKTLFRENLDIPRLSPTLVVDDSVRLSQEIDWMKIKDDSSKSFPGDHGTTALLFAASFTYLAGWRLGVLASLYAAFLCMPRLITGAHWLSDVIVGSGTITIVFLSWAFCTPLFNRFTNACERFFNWIPTLKKWTVLD